MIGCMGRSKTVTASTSNSDYRVLNRLISARPIPLNCLFDQLAAHRIRSTKGQKAKQN